MEKRFIENNQGRRYTVSNASIRYELNGNVELVIYDKGFFCDIDRDYNFDRRRMLKKNDNGEYEVVRGDFEVAKLRRSIRNSNKRSLQKFYDYGLANTWNYFITLTFDSKYVDRYDVFACKSLLKLFLRFLRRTNGNPEYLLVPEPHEKRDILGNPALHFHGFLKNVPNLRFSQAYYPDGNSIDSVYVLNDWKYGYSTLKIMPVENNNLQVINYCMKYITKTDNIEYNQPRYYHSRNLACCRSEVGFLNDFEKMDIISELQLVPVKVRDGYTVYRTVRKS